MKLADVVAQLRQGLATLSAHYAGHAFVFTPVGARVSLTSAVGQNSVGNFGAGVEVFDFKVDVGAEHRFAVLSEQETVVTFSILPQNGTRTPASSTGLDIQSAVKDLESNLSRDPLLSPKCAKIGFNFDLELEGKVSGGVKLVAQAGGEAGDSTHRSNKIEIGFMLTSTTKPEGRVPAGLCLD